MNDTQAQTNQETDSLILPIDAKGDLADLNHLTELLMDLYPDSLEDRQNGEKYLAVLGRVRHLSEMLVTLVNKV